MKLKEFPFEIILKWYKQNWRHNLPWRINQTPYTVWISEIFLQQTQVSRVVDYFNNVTKKFPDIQSLASTDYDTFFPYYQWLGYYSRARNMLKTAEIIHNQYDNSFPENYKELIALPGIWPYTAQAILAFWFGQNILAFDTNIEKIFARYYFWSRFVKLSKEFKISIQKQFEKTGISWRDINAALMDFSSTIDKNEKNLIDFSSYSLADSKFFKEKWKSENKPEKIKINHDKKKVEIFVILHKDHREYYSSHDDEFQTFSLWKHEWNHRHFIQNYFQKKYNIALSVRPAYKKTQHAFYYHAQIQLWKHDFWIFTKKDKLEWEEHNIKKRL